MSNIKVGDQVKVLSTEEAILIKAGTVGTVLEIDEDGDIYVTSEVCQPEGKGFFEKQGVCLQQGYTTWEKVSA